MDTSSLPSVIPVVPLCRVTWADGVTVERTVSRPRPRCGMNDFDALEDSLLAAGEMHGVMAVRVRLPRRRDRRLGNPVHA